MTINPLRFSPEATSSAGVAPQKVRCRERGCGVTFRGCKLYLRPVSVN